MSLWTRYHLALLLWYCLGKNILDDNWLFISLVPLSPRSIHKTTQPSFKNSTPKMYCQKLLKIHLGLFLWCVNFTYIIIHGIIHVSTFESGDVLTTYFLSFFFFLSFFATEKDHCIFVCTYSLYVTIPWLKCINVTLSIQIEMKIPYL